MAPIIMVDDSPSDLEIATICYQRSQLAHPWIAFDDASDFLAYLRSVSEGLAESPCIVLLDVNMPRMSGFEVLERIAAEAALAKPRRIVVFTTSDAEADRQRALSLGAESFVTKPIALADYTRFFHSLD